MLLKIQRDSKYNDHIIPRIHVLVTIFRAYYCYLSWVSNKSFIFRIIQDIEQDSYTKKTSLLFPMWSEKADMKKVCQILWLPDDVVNGNL